MTITFTQLQEISATLTELQDMKMPFKLGLIIAKNINLIKKETEFYVEQEKEFATKYLETDESGQFIQEKPNTFKIKTGLESECGDARRELDNFESEVSFKMIPMNLLESVEFTPKQLASLEKLIEEE